MPIALAVATLGVTKEQWNGPPGTPRCEELSENLLESWKNDFAAGERAFALQSQSYICEGVDCDGDGGFFAKYAWKCAAKGNGGVGSADILSPYVEYVLHGPGPEFHSYKPCQFFEDLLEGLPDGVTHNQTVASEDGSMCPIPYSDECKYPDPPASHTKLPHIEKTLLKWGGLLMNVDYAHPDYHDPNPHLQAAYWNARETISHGPIFGIEGRVCEASDDYSEPQAERAFYDGGVLIEQTRGPFTMRSFMFKSDGDRAIAMADSRNKGLPYAKSFAGENGCDTEVVWEIDPFPEGGFELDIGFPLDATTCEAEQRLRNAVAAYYTGEEIVVMVEYTALRASHFLDEDCGPSGYKELVRFASSFICVADGSQVIGDIIMFDDEDRPFAPEPENRAGWVDSDGWEHDGTEWNGQTIQAISRDASNPTKFFTGKGVDYMSPTGGVCTGATDERPPGVRFRVAASAADAPTSCGTFYWDPLLQAVAGDGVGLVIPEGGGGSNIAAIAGGAAAGAVVCILLVVIVACVMKRSKAKSSQVASV